MDNEKYIDKLYEDYNDGFERSLEYQKAAEQLDKKFSEIKVNFSENQLKDVEEFEQCLVELLEIEIKNSFRAGFRIATDLEREIKE